MKQRLSVGCLLLLLLCGWKGSQPLVQAAEKPPYWGSEQTYEPREGGGKQEIHRWRCPIETRSEPLLKSSDSSPVLQAVLLKDTKELSGAAILFFLKASILISENFPQYFQCNRPVDLQKLQKTISRINTNVQEALEIGETSREELNRIVTRYTLTPTSSTRDDGVLSLEVVGKVIQDVQISTRCDWKNNTIDTSGTIAVRGQKPDASIYRALGLGKGDRYPISVKKKDEIMTRLGELETLGAFQAYFAVDRDPDKLTWIICVWQKTEAELAMAEARQINVQNTESARQAIAKYQEAIALLRQPKILNSGKEKLKKFQLMQLDRGYFKDAPDDEKDALLRIAVIYAQVGEFYQSLNYYQQALATIRATGKKGEEAGTLTAIADIYNTLGNREQAHRYYKQALSTRLSQLQQQDSGGRRP